MVPTPMRWPRPTSSPCTRLWPQPGFSRASRTTCTGNYSGLWANHPLWIARWASSPGTLPAGAPFWSFWQYTSTGRVAGIAGNVDRNHFNGARTRLIALANNT
jgi:GH25 family lysozyme M1 (1,4-beta-N-acetylmuramidase)